MTESKVDAQNLDRARMEIGRLVGEMERLAESDMKPQEFYVELLRRAHLAAAAEASVLWIRHGGPWQAVAHVNLQQTGIALDERRKVHGEMLNALAETSEPGVFGPNANGVEGALRKVVNPTEFFVVYAPVVLEGATVGIVEYFHNPVRASGAPALVRMAAKTAQETARFLKNHRFRQVAGQEKTWNDLDAFVRTVHGGLNVKQVAYMAANDGRRLIGAERVSVAVKIGRTTRIAAISGQDTVEKRSNLVRSMAALANVVLERGETVVYQGAADPTWSKAVARAMSSYVEESNCRLAIVTPLVDPKSAGKRRKKAKGVLIVETIADEAAPEELAAKIEVVARHTSVALYNALEIQSIFLLPLWKALGKVGRLFSGSRLPTTVAVLTLLVSSILALVFVPWPLRMEGKGELAPVLRRTVFAPADGSIDQVKVDYLADVRVGGELLVMSSPKLDDELLQLQGSLRAKSLRHNAMQTALTQKRGRPQHELQSDQRAVAELETEIQSIENQIQLVNAQMEKLRLKAPIDGQILTWKPIERLSKRPVGRGEALLEVAETAGKWIVEVKFSESAVAHVQRAKAAAGGELPATLMLSSATDDTYAGVLYELCIQAQPEEGDNVCSAKIRLERAVPSHLRLAGAQVRVRVDCGQYPLGYVLLRELIDFIRARTFF